MNVDNETLNTSSIALADGGKGIFRMDYGKVIFMIDGTEVDVAKALTDGLYSKYFYGREDKIDKIEMFDENKLYKVIYPGRELPFDNLFQSHFQEWL